MFFKFFLLLCIEGSFLSNFAMRKYSKYIGYCSPFFLVISTIKPIKNCTILEIFEVKIPLLATVTTAA